MCLACGGKDRKHFSHCDWQPLPSSEVVDSHIHCSKCTRRRKSCATCPCHA